MASFYGGGGAAAGSGSGTSGVGISNIEINAKHHLIVFLTDGTRKDLGRVRGATFTREVCRMMKSHLMILNTMLGSIYKIF